MRRNPQAGQIERDLKLLHLADSRTYLLDIVKSAAERADVEQRFSEAILLYNLAEEYDAVIAVLNVELGNSLSRPAAGGSNGGQQGSTGGRDNFPGQSTTIGMAAGQEDLAQVARSILEHYDRSAHMSGKVSRRRRETCETLMRLKEALSAYERGQLEPALQVSAVAENRALATITDTDNLRRRLSRRRT